MSLNYNTNLAAEFYVLSILYRLGISANLTLGNKKSVDIIIKKDNGKPVTIDVKGLAGTTSWPVDNVNKKEKSHFFVFVTFLGKINVVNVIPEVYIVPSVDIDKYIYQNPSKTRKVVQLSKLRENKSLFRDRWDLIQKK